MSNFDNADFYDCRGAERYHCTTLDECIEDYVDGLGGPYDDVAKLIHDNGSITVRAFDPKGVSDESAKKTAQYMLDMAEEHWGEEFGDPEGDDTSFHEFLPRLEALVVEMWRSEKPWICEEVGRRDFDSDEIEAIARRLRPDWFEPRRCLTCKSTAPHLHPAMQSGGEVQPCRDMFHRIITPENTAEKIAEVEKLRIARIAAAVQCEP